MADKSLDIFENAKTFLWKKHNDLLLTGEEGKIHYVLIKDLNTFMYGHTLHRWRQCFCLQSFNTGAILKRYIKDWSTVNKGQQWSTESMVNKGLRCLRKVNKISFRIYNFCYNFTIIRITAILWHILLRILQ